MTAIGLSHVQVVRPNFVISTPVTYLAKTRQNLLGSYAVTEDAIDRSTLLSVLPTLTGEEDAAGRSRVLIA